MDLQNQTVEIEALKEAIAMRGNAALARDIKRRSQDLNNWMKRGRIPADACPALERAVGGQISCERFRPDVDWADRRYQPSSKVEG